MFENKENKAENNQIKHKAFASLDNKEKQIIYGQTKIKPQEPRPLSEEFEGRMRDLYEKGRKRGIRYSYIGIIGSVLICIIVLMAGYYLHSEIKRITKEQDEKEKEAMENFNLLNDPKNICNSDVCCLASLRKINKYEYAQIEKNQECAANFIKNRLDCRGSLYWCEPLAEQ